MVTASDFLQINITRYDYALVLLRLLTNDGVLLFLLQVADGDKVALHHGDIGAVLAGDDGGLSVQRHLVVVLH